jgi:hypothetical protein
MNLSNLKLNVIITDSILSTCIDSILSITGIGPITFVTLNLHVEKKQDVLHSQFCLCFQNPILHLGTKRIAKLGEIIDNSIVADIKMLILCLSTLYGIFQL